MIDLALAPARWLADRAWYALARRVLPAVDDNLADIGAVPQRLAAVGVPRQLDTRHGDHRATFDGKPIGARLDCDIAL